MAGDESKTCPPWIDEFIEDAGIAINTGTVPTAYNVWGPDGGEDDEDLSDPWIVHFYPSLGEVKGGANDGAIVHPGLDVDLITIQECFEDIEEFRLSSGISMLEPRYKGAMLEVIGWYDGHPVELKIFDKPPSDARVASSIHPDHVCVYNPEDPGR
jgi:hypothetical protein